MRRLFLSSVFCMTAACGAPAKVDPKAPADEPAVIDTRPKETAAQVTPATPKPSIIPQDPAQRQTTVSTLYAQSTAMMVFHDAKSLVQLYTSDATLTLPDSTVHGAMPVALTLISLAKTKSLSDFQRQSRGMAVLDDSTLADSGTYVMTMKRSPKDSVMERGRYAASIRVRANAGAWAILSDRITPNTSKANRR